MVGQRHKSCLKMTSNGLNDESLIKIYNEESYEGYFVEFDVHHPEKHLWPSQWFKSLPEKMKRSKDFTS